MPNTSISDGDLRVLAKLFALLDSPQENEATATLVRMRAMLRKSGTPLYQAVETRAFKMAIWDGMGKPECLKEYFEAAKLRREYEKLEAEFDEVAVAVMRLREVGKFCWSCELKRRVIAAMMGGALLAGWFHFSPPNVKTRLTICGDVLGASPLLAVYGRWRVINFKRDVAWVSATDNNLFRAVAGKWNRFLEALVLKH